MDPCRRPHVLDRTVAELRAHLAAAGAAAPESGVAERLIGAFHRGGAREFAALRGLSPARRARLDAALSSERLELLSCHPAGDGSARYAFRLADGPPAGLIVESVLLPHHRGSPLRTVCVSSQAGCPLACSFCATGRLGLARSLRAFEIVDQVVQVATHARVRVSDVVFMGMGEPLLNEEAVFRAAAVLNQPHGLQIGARRITISTAGVVPAIDRFIAARRPWRLVFSLGCADREKRRRLMPIQEQHGFDELLAAIARYERHRGGRHVTLEYVAIRNFTMGDDDVAALARELRGFRFLLNVIPFNPIGNGWEAPTMAEVRAFTAKLRPLGFPVKIRFSGGQRELAGCGQLGGSLLAAGAAPFSPPSRRARAAPRSSAGSR